MTSQPLNPALAQKLLSAVDSMPAFPRSVQHILELTRDVNCTPKALVEVIDTDPVVTVKILRAVNSAYYGLPKQITSIHHAVVYLGFNTIKNLALGIAAIGMMPQHNEAGFDIGQYLLHSLATAGVSRKLAQSLDDVDPMDGFIAGLLHDFGKVVLAQYFPQEFKQALALSQFNDQSLHLSLQSVIGTDHSVVGAMLAEKWRFSPQLVEAITYQYQTPAQCTGLYACVFAANQISKKLQFGHGGNPCVYPLPEPVQKLLGGDLDAVIANAGDLHTVFQEVQMFAKL